MATRTITTVTPQTVVTIQVEGNTEVFFTDKEGQKAHVKLSPALVRDLMRQLGR